MTASSDSKVQLRRALKARRAALTPAETADAWSAIAAHLHPLIQNYERIAGFSATQGEVDLSALYEALLARGTSLCFPRVEGPGEMVFVEVNSLDELRPGAFGVLEPLGDPVEIGSIEVFLVPALGFDRHGTRLGFGGGYYDRALGRRREAGDKVPLFLGIGYSCQVLETFLPVEDWDIPVDSVVTDSGVIPVG